VRRITPIGVAVTVVILGALVAFPFVFKANWVVNIAVFTMMYAGLATAWNLLGGYSGYLSLGNAAFFGVGAYVMANWFPTAGGPPGYTPFLVLPLLGLAVAILSLPIAWIAFRTRDATFAIVTITLLFVAQTLAFLLHSYTNGSSGMGLGVPRFDVATYERPFYLALLAIFALGVFLCWYATRSKLGLMLFAIRDDEDRARGVGVNTEAAKLVTFAISLGLTAMIGGVWAYYMTYIYPQFAVDPLVTIGMVLMVFLGGRGTLWGPLLGAVLLVPAQQMLAQNATTAKWYLVLYSAVFLIVILLMPRGIIPSIQDLIAKYRSSPKDASLAGEEPTTRVSGEVTP
jgi:branched-chain amino acid transport system permease protein